MTPVNPKPLPSLTPAWFTRPQGGDVPKKQTTQAARLSPCRVTFEGNNGFNGYVSCRVKFVLDSQQPFVMLSVDDGLKHIRPQAGHVVFTLQDYNVNYGYENEFRGEMSHITYYRQSHPNCFEGMANKVAVTRLVPRDPSKKILRIGNCSGMEHEAEERYRLLCERLQDAKVVWVWQDFKDDYILGSEALSDWIDVLNKRLRKDSPQPRAFWYYSDIDLKDMMKNNIFVRFAEMPWLWSAPPHSQNRTYTKLRCHNSFFCDENDHLTRLLVATLAEHNGHRDTIESIFNPARIHSARFRRLPGKPRDYHVHVKVLDTGAAGGNPAASLAVPRLLEMTQVKWALVDDNYRPSEKGKAASLDLILRGHILDKDSGSDFVMLVQNFTDEVVEYKDYRIVTVVKPDLSTIETQIRALVRAGSANVQRDGEHGKCFSLRRTILAHSVELDPYNRDLFFQLDIRAMTSLEPQILKDRLNMIQNLFPLNDMRRLAFDQSTTRITAGVSLVQGPPGTGKTRTAMTIVLALAALNFKVLVCAGSNKGVDNLAAAVIHGMDHPGSKGLLKAWCGQLIRFRTPAFQMSVLRRHSATTHAIRRHAGELGGLERDLEPYQSHVVAVEHAQRRSDKYSVSLTNLLRRDRESRLSMEDTKTLKLALFMVTQEVLEKTKIVASTLSNCEQIPPSFKPDFIVCDESGQCLESEHMIPMTTSSVKGVILIGDQAQLPPTVITQHSNNEGADYSKRSLLERLFDAGYPAVTLQENYRNHPHILELVNDKVYEKQLIAASSTSTPDRVSRVWDSFTCSRHHFYNFGLEGRRRIFVSVSGLAILDGNTRSWINMAQISAAAQFLQALYTYCSPNGEKIQPDDVLVISPCRAQRALVKETFTQAGVRYHDNLTVDASQGQEAKVVIWLLTKPSEKTGVNVDFLNDKPRMNVALTRAQKVLIIFGDLGVWSEFSVKEMDKKTNAKLLVALLRDVHGKRDVLHWRGPSNCD